MPFKCYCKLTQIQIIHVYFIIQFEICSFIFITTLSTPNQPPAFVSSCIKQYHTNMMTFLFFYLSKFNIVSTREEPDLIIFFQYTLFMVIHILQISIPAARIWFKTVTILSHHPHINVIFFVSLNLTALYWLVFCSRYIWLLYN